MKIYNTIKQSLDILELNSDVKMYVCGITPYDETHLGHARCYVVFDILRRYLEYKGYKINFVQNFTDVDDKIINKSRDLGVRCKELTQKYIDSYFEVEQKLNIKPANVYPKVTEHIPEIISVIEKLVQKEFAYVTNTGVYFEIAKFKEYGKLSKRNLEDLIAGARVEPDETKKSALDFALWKFSKEDEPQEVKWNSPWGVGRPGWHIECSVMSTKYLGETLDFHGGGQDLIFPHHENEIAQSEALTGKEFVRYWVHNGFVTVNKEKMSKSLKNIFAVRDLLKEYEPMVLRLFLISQHYRNPLDFSIDEINQFKSVWERIVNVKENAEMWIKNLPKGNLNDSNKKIVDDIVREFETYMNDDLNTSGALASLHKLINHLYVLEKSLTKGISKQDISYCLEKLILLCENILGLKFPLINIPQEIYDLVEKRNLARQNKDFLTADNVRKQVFDKGYILEDTPFGTRIRKR